MAKEMPEATMIAVNGPEELKATLQELMDKPGEHYLDYRFNQQHSYLKLDVDPTNQKPLHMWYADTADRPATMAVKSAVAEIANVGLDSKQFTEIFEDFFKKDLASKLEATYTGEHLIARGEPLKRLQQAKRPLEALAEKPIEQVKAVPRLFSLFGGSGTKKSTPLIKPEEAQKKDQKPKV